VDKGTHVTAEADDALSDFRALYREHYGFIWHALHRFGIDSAALDDAAQDVFLVAYRRRIAFQGSSPRPWLYGIARRVASNYRRSKRRRTDRERVDAVERPDRSGAREAIETLDRYLASLRPEDRELFILSEVEGMTGPEIAEARGRNLRTIYTRIRKLRLDMRTSLDLSDRVRRERPTTTASSWAVLAPLLQSSSPAIGAIATASLAGRIGTITLTQWVGVAATVGVATSLVVGLPSQNASRTEAVAADERVLQTSHSRNSEPEDDVVSESDEASPPFAGSPLRSASIELSTPELTLTKDAHKESAAGNPEGPLHIRRQDPPSGAIGSKARANESASPTNVGRADAGSTNDAKPKPSGPTPSTDLETENELLRHATEAIRSRDHVAALQLSTEHGRRFPESAFGDLQTALHIEALCGLGRQVEARARARTFLAAHPGSPVAEKIERICSLPKYRATPTDKAGI